MQHYSPPLTRQKAKALIFRQQRSAAQRGRDTGQAQRSESDTAAAATAGVGGRSRGRGNEDSAASNRPKSAATLGNAVSRCRKARSRGGAGGSARDSRDPAALSPAAVADSKDASTAEPSFSAPASPLPRGAVSPRRGADIAPAVGGPITLQNQPLEEVNPSVLNAKAPSSAGGSSCPDRSDCKGEGGADGVASRVARRAGMGVAEGESVGIGGAVDDGGHIDDATAHRETSSGPVLPTPPAAQTIERSPSVDSDQSPTIHTRDVAHSNTGRGIDEPSGRGVRPPRAGIERSIVINHTVEASRLNGKSVQAKGSTGVSPMQKRNRRELKLSEEETAMAGAPQGPVYQVAVLETRQFEASHNPAEEMQAVLTAAGGTGDWADLYSAVDSARRLCIFHKDVLMREGYMKGAVGLVTAAVGNLRSSMVRNALLGVGDMFSFLGQDMARVDLRPMVAGTLQRLAGDKRFICQTAAQAMEAAARHGPGVDVLHAILPGVEDRNAEVSAKAAVYTEQCLAALGVGAKAGSGLPERINARRLLAGMGRAVNGKVAEGRTAAKRALLRSRKAMGREPFEAFVKESLEKSDAASVLSTLAAYNSTGVSTEGGVSRRGKGVPGKGRGVGGRPLGGNVGGGRSAGRGGAAAAQATGGGARPSIREQMMARKRQQEEKRRAENDKSVGGADGAVDEVTARGGVGGGGAEGFLIAS